MSHLLLIKELIHTTAYENKDLERSERRIAILF
jgi:hypothetical protein